MNLPDAIKDFRIDMLNADIAAINASVESIKASMSFMQQKQNDQYENTEVGSSQTIFDNLSIDSGVNGKQIAGWTTAASTGVALTTDLLVGQYDPASTRVLRYFTVSDLSNSQPLSDVWITNINDHATVKIGSAHIDITGKYHKELAGLNDADQGHTIFLYQNKTTTDNKTVSIQGSTGNSYVNFSTATLSDGTNNVLNWDVAGGTWSLKFGATNWWNSANLLVDITGNAALLADGKLDVDIGAASAWKFTDYLTVDPSNTTTGVFTVGSNKILLGFDVYSAYVHLRGNGSTGELYLGDLSTAAFPSIYFNGVAGIDISGWTTKGGLTGTGISEITWGDLQPTDKILVRR